MDGDDDDDDDDDDDNNNNNNNNTAIGLLPVAVVFFTFIRNMKLVSTKVT